MSEQETPPFNKRRQGAEKHRPLREDVKEIDQQILRLLLRRFNLLEKMRQKGRLNSFDDKYLRSEWQQASTRISKDANLSGRFFSLMQDIKFLQPQSGKSDKEAPKERRQAFNLTPPHKAIDLSLQAPVDEADTIAWIYLGAASGQKLTLSYTLRNTGIVNFINALEQMGADIQIEGAMISCQPGLPLEHPDKALYIGHSRLNFYLLLAHYLGRYSRLKLLGDDNAVPPEDFVILRRLLPQLGARMIHVVPKSESLPIRLECSGMLPPGLKFPADLSWLCAFALLIAAPFYESPISINLQEHPEKETVLARALPILEAAGAVFHVDVAIVNLEPSQLHIPAAPGLPIDATLAAFLLALAQPLCGTVNLRGSWPLYPHASHLLELLRQLRIDWQTEGANVSSNALKPLKSFELTAIELDQLLPVLQNYKPLLVALAVCAALADGNASLPHFMEDDADVSDFLHAAGISMLKDGVLKRAEAPGCVWNAPTAEWAAALALAACARPGKTGFQLGNPHILNTLWPEFWSLYNSMHGQEDRYERDESKESEPKRRRIITSAVAVPPEIREEDWD